MSNNNCFPVYFCAVQCLGPFSNKDNIPNLFISVKRFASNKAQPFLTRWAKRLSTAVLAEGKANETDNGSMAVPGEGGGSKVKNG